jgi:HAD superfamily phosphatase
MDEVIVFDMDGVLADVSESYRAAITETVRHYTGQTIPPSLIQKYKDQGGWNNDWALAQQLIADTANIQIPYDQVIDTFQSLFLGTNNDGLILRENWLPKTGLLETLSQRAKLAIFTGRPRPEVHLTLNRFVPNIPWSIIIADEDTPNAKPAPDGLLAIQAAHEGSRLTYLGDTVDDARSAKAANVRFIGIAHPRHPNLAALLKAEGAEAVIEDINEIERVL